MATEGASGSSSASESSEKSEAIQKASELLAQGKRNMVCGEIPKAVGFYEEAVQLLVKSCGELSRDCADAYYNCGSALLELGRMETSVLGAALDGVDVEEEKEEEANEQFEKPLENDSLERQELRKEVYKAMAERDREEEMKFLGKSSQSLAANEPIQPGDKSDREEEMKSLEKSSQSPASNEPIKPEDKSVVDKTKQDTSSQESQQKTLDEKDISDEKMEEDSTVAAAFKLEDKSVVDKTKQDTSQESQQKTLDDKDISDKKMEEDSTVAAAIKPEDKSVVDKTKQDTSQENQQKTLDDKDISDKKMEENCTVAAAIKPEDKSVVDMTKQDTSQENQQKTLDDKDISDEKMEENCIVAAAVKPGEEESGATRQGSETAKVDHQSGDGNVGGVNKELPGDKKISSDEKPQDSKTADGAEEENTKTEEEEEEAEDKGTDADKDVSGEVAEDADEEEEEEENAAEDTVSQEGEELEGEEDVPNFQLSWEYLDLAKVIYLKSDEQADQLKAAECYIRLGELSMETEQHATAAEDLESALKIQQKYLPADDRLIAETHYQLGLAYGLGKEFELSIKHYTEAIAVIEAKIASLSKLVEEAEADKGKPEDDQVKKYQDEIKELQELIPEMRNKIEDSREEAKDMEKMKDMAKEILGFSGSSKKFDSPTKKSEPLANDKTAEVDENGQRKATDIAHLVRKKRKPDTEDSQLPNGQDSKKIKQDNTPTETSSTDVNASSGMDVDGNDDKCKAEHNKNETPTAEPVPC